MSYLVDDDQSLVLEWSLPLLETRHCFHEEHSLAGCCFGWRSGVYGWEQLKLSCVIERLYVELHALSLDLYLFLQLKVEVRQELRHEDADRQKSRGRVACQTRRSRG